MKLFKKAVSLFFIFMMAVFILPGEAFATEPSVLEFSGFESYRGFKWQNIGEAVLPDKDLFKEFKGLMPGDEKTQEIIFKNTCPTHDSVVLHLSFDAEEITAEKLAFLNQLDMEIFKEGEGAPLFSGKAGETITSLELGDFAKNTETKFLVKLKVPKEMGNEYMDFMAELNWKFTVLGKNFHEITVKVIWDVDKDEFDYTKYVLDAILRQDGENYSGEGGRQKLNKDNNWSYTWYPLPYDHAYDVEVKNIPIGYTVVKSADGTVITIVADASGPIPPPPGPGGGGGGTGDGDGATGRTNFTVEKIWKDTGKARPAYCEVELIENDRIKETVVLDEHNVWMHTFMNLKPDRVYRVREKNIPVNYDVEYEYINDRMKIINTENGQQGTGYLEVFKKWDEGAKKVPDYIYVTLFQNDRPVQTVKLGKFNDWHHVWNGLSLYDNYTVKEVTVPQGYTAVYFYDLGKVTILNQFSLLQTGNDKMLPFLLTGAGILLVILGIFLKKKKDKKDE